MPHILASPRVVVNFLFIYFMPTHIRALGNETKGKEWNRRKRQGKAGRQFDRCRRLSGSLTDSQKWVWPVVGREQAGRAVRVKNGSLLFFVLFYVAFIRVFLSSFNRRGEHQARTKGKRIRRVENNKGNRPTNHPLAPPSGWRASLALSPSNQ